MNKIKTSLLKIVGRIIKVLTDMFVNVGVMCIPMGFGVLLGFLFVDDWRMYVGICVGLLLVFVGYLSFKYALKFRIIENAEKEKTRQENLCVLNDILKELKQLNNKQGSRDEL